MDQSSNLTVINGPGDKNQTHQGTCQPPAQETASLSCGAQLFIWSLRQWVVAVKHKTPPIPLITTPYEMANCPDAPPLIDELMCFLAVSSNRQLEIRCCCRPTLSEDEMLLLSCLRLLQREQASAGATLMEHMMLPGLSRTFCRLADEYQQLLQAAGMTLDNPRTLHLVS